MPEPQVLLSGLAIGESPRWPQGRLWFSNWGTQEIVAVDLEGNGEIVGEGPPGLGWATAWLPDGRLLVTGQELTRREPDGSMVKHADLSGVADNGWSEIVVDGRSNIYLKRFRIRLPGRRGAPSRDHRAGRPRRLVRSRTASSSPTAWS